LRPQVADDADTPSLPRPGAVFVATLHRAKGLRFRFVLFVGAADKKIPGIPPRSEFEFPPQLLTPPLAGRYVFRDGATAAHLKAERRLAYVALTRATEKFIFRWGDLNFKKRGL
jgi:superfamily I DNA/RNA helicase